MLPLKFKDFYTLTFVDLGYYNPNDPMVGIVYCPGLICMKTNRPLFYGVVTKENQGYVLSNLHDYDELTHSDWDAVLDQHTPFFSATDFLLDSKLPAEHKNYFRSLNHYRRLLPDNTLARDLLDIYLDGGLLTRAQRLLVDSQLFLGSDVSELIYSFEMLRLLDVLTALGPQPGLDQIWLKTMVTRCKTVSWNEEDSTLLFENLKKFSHLIKPLSTELVSTWPPTDHVLSLP